MDVSNVRRPDEWPFEMPRYLSEAIEALIGGLERDDDYNLGGCSTRWMPPAVTFVTSAVNTRCVTITSKAVGTASPAIWTRETTVVGKIGNDAYDVGY